MLTPLNLVPEGSQSTSATSEPASSTFSLTWQPDSKYLHVRNDSSTNWDGFWYVNELFTCAASSSGRRVTLALKRAQGDLVRNGPALCPNLSRIIYVVVRFGDKSECATFLSHLATNRVLSMLESNGSNGSQSTDGSGADSAFRMVHLAIPQPQAAQLNELSNQILESTEEDNGDHKRANRKSKSLLRRVQSWIVFCL